MTAACGHAARILALGLVLGSSLAHPQVSPVARAAAAGPAVAPAVRDRLRRHHRLYLPAGNERVAGVVAVPGCSGVSLDPPATDLGGGSPTDPLFRRHYPRMAERLRAHGHAVLLVDYLGGEGVVNACSGEVPPSVIADYIAEGVGWLRDHARVDASRVHVLAWSLGGAGLLAHLRALPGTSAPYRSAIAVYPACEKARPWTVPVPVLFLLGGADDIAPAASCEALVAGLPAGSVHVRRYEGARHGFDVEGASERVSTGRGTTVGRDARAAAAAWDEITRFLGEGRPAAR
ncbi:MAG TPA: dienelactone hydrolase family protein [Vicinamibacteria bacterium]|nr:dienelactone hydrolase family protein [Vicinamibacteria bacterium]